MAANGRHVQREEPSGLWGPSVPSLYMPAASLPDRSRLAVAALALAAAAVAIGAILSGGGGTAPTEVLGVQYTASSTTASTAAGTESAATGSTSTAPVVRSTAPATPSGTPLRPAAGPTTTAVAPTGSVAGRFSVDGHGIGGVVVTLIDSLGGRTTTTTDASGAYLLDAVITGAYRLELADPGDSTPLCDTAGNCITTRPLRVESRSVEVEAGRRSTVDVEL